MKLIKKLARKLLFSKKKQSPAPVFQTKPTTSVNSIAEPVITFEKPKLDSDHIGNNKVESDTETCLDKTPIAKKPGRPKGQKSAAAKKPAAKKASPAPKQKKTI